MTSQGGQLCQNGGADLCGRDFRQAFVVAERAFTFKTRTAWNGMTNHGVPFAQGACEGGLCGAKEADGRHF